MDETEKALTAIGKEEAEGKRGLARRSQPNLKGQTVVTRTPNRVFENRKERGEISKEKSPLILRIKSARIIKSIRIFKNAE